MTRPMHHQRAPLPVRLRDVSASLGHDSRTSIIDEAADRIAELEAALREMQKSVPGGTNCDPQQVADTLREIAGKVGVKIID